jgi:hypothetical protein
VDRLLQAVREQMRDQRATVRREHALVRLGGDAQQPGGGSPQG